ncbi:MAG: AMP-binding protein, partial [Hoeflea sp.]|nr:AMP-binding protein [Hoeflea sp.]
MRRKDSVWKTRLNGSMIARFTSCGAWSGITLAHSARQCARETPDRVAVIDGGEVRTFRQVFDEAVSLVAVLHEMGMVQGDVLSFQLPNWRETMVINLAASLGGFIVNPVVPIYRDAEVGFILRNSRTRVLFVPETFRGFDYLAMVERLRPELPDLQEVIVVRGERPGYTSYLSSLTKQQGVPRPEYGANPDEATDVDPNDVKLLLYTSGTTGHPKGVLHSHNTLRSEVDAVTNFWKLSQDDVILMPSPVTHITGYLYALEMTFALGAPVVFMDRWNAVCATELVVERGVTVSIGATPFLAELVAELESQRVTLPSLRLFACGGAPVPTEVVRRANNVLPNCLVFRVYGSSEAPTITVGVAAGDPAELGASTDGCIVNHEVRIVDAVNGEPLPDGKEGEILTRGPEVMLGYTRWEDTLDAFDEDGFFRTGDLGFISHDRYITISGRKKDLIIRGGENISAKEIEDVLYRHPAVAEAAVVAMPHLRMGETPAAFVVLRPGTTLTFEEMTAFLEEARLARQKIPERLFTIDQMPQTASGKVLKHV